MRVVLDTNIWISGLLLPKSIAGKVLSAWRQAQFEVITSSYILEEIKRVLSYPKIVKRIGWDKKKIEEYLLLLSFSAYIIEVEEIKVTVLTDPADSFVLATLLASQADYLVTGDADLLGLNSHFPILSLIEFYEKIGI